MLEAILVAAMTAVIAFLLIYFVEDCQALGKDPIEHPLQVCVRTMGTRIYQSFHWGWHLAFVGVFANFGVMVRVNTNQNLNPNPQN